MNALDVLNEKLAQRSQEPQGAVKVDRGSQSRMSPEDAQKILSTRLPGMPLAANDISGALGTMGGALPGPLGVAGAGVGAGLGDLITQGYGAMLGQPVDPGRSLRKGTAAAAGAGIGFGTGKVLGGVGGIITGRIRKQAAKKAVEEYAKATQAGTTIDTYDLLKDLKKLTDRAGRAASSDAEAVIKEAQDFLANKGRAGTPLDVHEIRQVADDIAGPSHAATRKLLKQAEPASRPRIQLYRLIADNARQQLRDKVPAATPHMRKASTAINLARWVPKENIPSTAGGLMQRTGAGAMVGAAMGGPAGAVPGALINFIASQPQLLQLFGHLLDNPATKQGLLQAGGALGSATQE